MTNRVAPHFVEPGAEGQSFKTVGGVATWVDGSTGGVESVVAGTGIAVDNTDPANPIVSATGGGGGGGGVLASKAHNPTTDVTYSTTSGSMVDIDATNLAVTFTAPSSGAVLVTLSGLLSMSSTGSIAFFGLRDSAGLVVGSQMEMYYNTNLPLRLTGICKITGLTPGTSYTWKWAWMRLAGSATLNMSAGRQLAGSYGPATMIVEAA